MLSNSPERKVLIEVSARHIHLSPEHLETLFGKRLELRVLKIISQPHQFAAQEKVILVGPKGKLEVRVVGPLRAETQVELSATDCHALGLPVVLRVSGNLSGTAGVLVQGPKGQVELGQGVIVAQRHLHISPSQASAYGLKHGDSISIKTNGTRPITFHNVFVRSREGVDEMSFMIDTDEANSAGLANGDEGVVIND